MKRYIVTLLLSVGAQLAMAVYVWRTMVLLRSFSSGSNVALVNERNSTMTRVCLSSEKSMAFFCLSYCSGKTNRKQATIRDFEVSGNPFGTHTQLFVTFCSHGKLCQRLF